MRSRNPQDIVILTVSQSTEQTYRISSVTSPPPVIVSPPPDHPSVSQGGLPLAGGRGGGLGCMAWGDSENGDQVLEAL